MKQRLLLTSVMLVILLCATLADARLFYVPGDFGAIQEAIDGVEARDTILVSPGTYRESLDFHGQDIVLIGVNRTELVPHARGTGVAFSSGEPRSAQIHNFYIHDFQNVEGGAVSLSNFSNPTFIDCIFERCRVDSSGGAILAENSRAQFTNCIFRSNSAKYGGAIALLNGADCQFSGCTFNNNHASESGGAFYINNAHPQLYRCIVRNNRATTSGGGIYYSNRFEVELEIDHCTFYCNESALARTIFAYNSLSISNSIFWHDRSPEIYIGDRNTEILFCDIKTGLNAVIGSPVYDSIISSDPRFVDPLSNDFHITPLSPCVDAGNPRTANDEDGTRADIGVYSYFYPNQPLFWAHNSELDFGRHGLSKTSELELLLANNGRLELEIEVGQPDNDAFTIDGETAFTLDTRETHSLTVSFTPERTIEYSGRFRITTNDPSHQEVWIDLDGSGYRTPELIVEPEYVAMQIDTFSHTEFSINLSNEGHSTLEWQIRKQAWFSYPGSIRGDRGYPPFPDRLFTKHAAGTTLETYPAPRPMITGLTWDGSQIWSVAEYLGNAVLSCYNPENMEIVKSFQIDHRPRGLCCVDGELWILAPNFFYSYTLDGEAIGNLPTPILPIKDFCCDDKYFYLISSETLWVMDRNNRDIVFESDIIQEFGYATFQLEAITYTPDHIEAPLNVLISASRYGLSFLVQYQFSDQFGLNLIDDIWLEAFGTDALCHDGNNFIHSGNIREAVFNIIEDGVDEPEWLTYEMEFRDIEPQGDTDLFLMFQTDNIQRGDYGALLHILTNDPDMPDNIIPIILTVADPETEDDHLDSPTPASCHLEEVYPNPCNGSATIEYSLPYCMKSEVNVFDLTGRLVTTLASGVQDAGKHRIEWCPENEGSGTYFIKLKAGHETICRKILYLR